jgi:hypothetical protein
LAMLGFSLFLFSLFLSLRSFRLSLPVALVVPSPLL